VAWAPDYATLAQVKKPIGIDVDDTRFDVELQQFLTSACRAIDTDTLRQFGQLAEVTPWEYTAEWRSELAAWMVPIDDLQSTDDLTVEFDGAPITTFTLLPRNAPAKGKAYTRISIARDDAGALDAREGGVIVAERFGWLTVPITITAAAILQTSRFYARRESPYGVAGSPDMGNEMRLLSKLDADVPVMLAGYRRAARPR
jgi:hypothetical protein